MLAITAMLEMNKHSWLTKVSIDVHAEGRKYSIQIFQVISLAKFTSRFQTKNGRLLPVSNKAIRTVMWQGKQIKEQLLGGDHVKCMKETIENVTAWNTINSTKSNIIEGYGKKQSD